MLEVYEEKPIDHPIKQSLEECKTFLELLLQSKTICELDPTISNVSSHLISRIQSAEIELHKLLTSAEYVNELVASLQKRLTSKEENN
jgi:hypothetical protein